MAGTQPSQPLATRHVFIDTESYKQRGHNLTVRPFTTLGEYLTNGRLILHTTDILYREVERHIKESAASTISKVRDVERELKSWQHKTASDLKLDVSLEEDAKTLSDSAFRQFKKTLKSWRVEEHQAMTMSAETVFEQYFLRRPPFDKEGSKEFPDAFMLVALEKWCASRKQTMLVVSRDKALQRAVASSHWLCSVDTIDEVLRMAAALEEPEITEQVDALVSNEAFVPLLTEQIEANLGNAGFEYVGDLYADCYVNAATVVEWKLQEVTALAMQEETIELMIHLEAQLQLEVGFEDRTNASYDREDGVWWGVDVGEATIFSDAPLRLYAQVDLASGEFLDSELMERDIPFSEATDEIV